MKIDLPCLPKKIVLVGLNYRKHAKELGMDIPSEPILFLKPPSSLIRSGQDIIYPQGVKRIDYEAELAVIIKKRAKCIKESRAKDYILGYSCLNDVTARNLQKKDGQWTRAKSFDTFCPLGPCVETDLNPDSLKIQTFLNGKIKQSSNTSDFIFSVNYILSFISKVMTLEAGDIVSTGTPEGIGPMQKGDKVVVDIEGIGSLENQVV
ncbi:MAG: fumarylacetoacetate hydrolase family protein [Candidatus Omnitrophica bacterium]|nr:fumarylacetoacetate hydrolase family protein [Candidatus Omnitrophota bacterium]MCF7894050.1 fumarylacetoacetate hydrolase family protein [Candidatus Omnitrophota bacterium]